MVLGDTVVPVTRIKQIMEAAPAWAKGDLLDACHSGANIGHKGPQPMTPAFIQRVFEQAEGMVILASCKQGQLSYEWRAQERSVFTHYLLDASKVRLTGMRKASSPCRTPAGMSRTGPKLWASQRNVADTPTLYSVEVDIGGREC